MSITLTPAQLRMVVIIESECEAVALGWLFEALVTNAYAESLLNPSAIGDHGLSVGLFQLHERGAGRGMSVERRKDPVENTKQILRVVQSPQGDQLRVLHKANAPNEALVAGFAHSIERCAACGHQAGDAELVRRRSLYRELFPLPVA